LLKDIKEKNIDRFHIASWVNKRKEHKKYLSLIDRGGYIKVMLTSLWLKYC
jgi:hypothetical protein